MSYLMQQEFSFITLFARGSHFYSSLSIVNRKCSSHYSLNNISNAILTFTTKFPNFSPLSESTTKSLALSPVLGDFSEKIHRIFNIFMHATCSRVTHILVRLT